MEIYGWWYHSVYDRARKIEGASQRVQEDTIKFTDHGRIRHKFNWVYYDFNTIYSILFGLSVGIGAFLVNGNMV